MPHITITIDSTNPDAYDQLCEYLSAHPPVNDYGGGTHAAVVSMVERVYDGLAERRRWVAEYQPPADADGRCDTNPGGCAEHSNAGDGSCAAGHRPDDMPALGDRCKDCGRQITWVGPGMYDWTLSGA